MHVIVGIDAGIKTGYAVLDLDGRLLSAGCEKQANDERMVEVIRHVGIPSLIACDVKKPPSFVSKVAARFNVRVFRPSRNLSTYEKKKLGANILDTHMRDAYAAAVKAYNNYNNRFRQIDNLPTHEHKNELKHLVLQGHALTKLLQNKKQSPSKKSKRKKPCKPKRKLKRKR